ncbi:hypothetical protein PFISCL1PPCAC_17959, partial [Pristionchus fissidentatus]
MKFAWRSNKRWHRYETSEFMPDPQEVLALPTMTCILVKRIDDDPTQGFSDVQALEIARKEHNTVSYPAVFSDPATTSRLIEMILKSGREQNMSVYVTLEYLHKFLASIGLREERNKLLDISEPESPIVLLKLKGDGEYYLTAGSGYVHISSFTRTIQID